MSGSALFSSRLLRPLLVLAAITCGGRARPATVTIDARNEAPAVEALPFPIGDRSPDGHVISANNRYLTYDSAPWYPTAGEFHFSRYPAAEWEREILKMKAGGLDVVATYVFWLHHEETEGRFDWSGRKNLRAFIDLCGRHGMKVWLRIGPWCHGEARNGGFPDWLVASGIPLRQNDPRYLALVTRYFGEIAEQVRGKFWRDGGPIFAVQIENEYHPARGGIEHMRELRQRALEAGMHPAFFSATGWDQAAVPPTDFLPVFGGYTEQFWSASLTELPPNQNFFFTPIRAEDNVMGDLTPKIARYNSKYDGFPFLTAELGGGMSIAYHRRPLMAADDSTAAAVVKLGSGANCLGYYMYHGGTNPEGKTPLQETQAGWNGYNDMEVKSYDFQAPLREFGQVNETYRTLKVVHLFLRDFGSDLAPMVPRFPNEKPANRDDATTPRVAARTTGDRGYVFVNNYQRNHPLGVKHDFQVALQLPGGTVLVPQEPTTLPEGAYPILPVNLDLGGVTLRYATAQLLCRLPQQNTFVFFGWPGLASEFAFTGVSEDGITAPQGKIERQGDVTRVRGIEPGRSVAIVAKTSGGAKPIHIVVLSRSDALNLSKATLGGTERLVLTPAAAAFDGDRIVLASRSNADFTLGLFPAPQKVIGEFRRSAASGVFEQYEPTERRSPPLPAIAVTPLRAAEEPAPVRLSAKPRAVAIEPDDQAFAQAAAWRLDINPQTFDRSRRLFLRVEYEGDVARVYSDGRLDNDNFYKGEVWELALWRYSPEELRHGLQLKVLPLRRDAPIFLERRARPDFTNGGTVARLKTVTIAEELQAEVTVRK